MSLLNVKMTSSSILEMQRSEWPETLLISPSFTLVVRRQHKEGFSSQGEKCMSPCGMITVETI
jgi:hypothetical protein